jgi:hypothetical protein
MAITISRSPSLTNSNVNEAPEFRDWLIVTPYYHPEVGAPQIRLPVFVKELTRLGYRVTVLTGMPKLSRRRDPRRLSGQV